MFDIDRFIADCREALRDPVPQLAVKELVERAVSDSRGVELALGAPAEAGLQTLYRSPDLTILDIAWAPCMTLYPHDHRMWAVIGIYGGREENLFYRRGPDGIARAGEKRLDRCDTLTLGRDVIHAVNNPLRQFTGGIHVYGGDFFGVPRSEWDPETLEERPYDVERARRVFAEANERWLAESAP